MVDAAVTDCFAATGLCLAVCVVECGCALCSRLAVLLIFVLEKSVVAVCGVLLLRCSLGMVALSDDYIIAVIPLSVHSWKRFDQIELGEDISLKSPD